VYLRQIGCINQQILRLNIKFISAKMLWTFFSVKLERHWEFKLRKATWFAGFKERPSAACAVLLF